MTLAKKSVLRGLSVAVTAFVVLYGYQLARAERHWAFDRACASGNAERGALLLRLGADPNGTRDAHYYSRYGWTVFETTPPLHLAASRGHTQVVHLLLAHGADSSVRNSESLTAGDCARLGGHADIAQLLATAQHQ